MAGEGHVTLAWGRDYGDVVPVGGIVMGGSDHVVEVGVDVIPGGLKRFRGPPPGAVLKDRPGPQPRA